MLKQLNTFLSVCQYGSFASAGHHLGLTQSAVSSQIKALEHTLGYALFDRSGQRAILTPQAEQVLPHIKHILQQIHDLKEYPKHNALYRQLTFGAIASIQTGILPDVLAQFYQQAPDVHLTIKPATSLQLLAMLEQNELDFALMLKPPFQLPKSFYVHEFCQQQYCLIVPQDCLMTQVDEILQHYPVIRYDALSLGGREVDDYLERQHLQIQERFVIDDLEAIVAMVERGLGVAIIPNAGLWKQRPTQLNILPLERPIYRTLAMVMPYRQKKSPLIQCFLACLNHLKLCQ